MNKFVTPILILILMFFTNGILSLDCYQYDNQDECISDQHVLCAFCSTYDICVNYDPCSMSLEDTSIFCPDYIVNNSTSNYYQYCSAFTIDDYIVMLFVVVLFLAAMYLIARQEIIRIGCVKAEKVCDVICWTICCFIVLSLIFTFVLYRAVLYANTDDIENLYILLTDITFGTIMILCTLMIVVLLIVLLVYFLGTILVCSNDTRFKYFTTGCNNCVSSNQIINNVINYFKIKINQAAQCMGRICGKKSYQINIYDDESGNELL